MMTAKGIYLDLEESTYFYRFGNYKFYFSSKLYRGNFIKRVEQGIKREKDKFECKDANQHSLCSAVAWRAKQRKTKTYRDRTKKRGLATSLI